MSKWPKHRTTFTPEQQRVFSDWYAHWLPILNGKMGWVTKFNHAFPGPSLNSSLRILEIGVGEGHASGPQAYPQYFALDLIPHLAQTAAREYGHARIVAADVEGGIPFQKAAFDCVLAVHVLEHLANLPLALDEVLRVLRPGGRLVVVIPCEGGLGYTVGRNVSVRRIYNKRFGRDCPLHYDQMIHWDHINTARDVLGELRKRFRVTRSEFFPLRMPFVDINLCIGLELEPRS